MERRVKERLIGATILVVVVVALVPEFLSGRHGGRVQPPAEPASSNRTFLVDVAHIDTAPPAPQPPQPPPQPPASPAAAEPGAASAVSPIPVPTAPAATPAPALAPAPSPPATASSAWNVQVGSFASKANAESLMHQLNAEGFSAHLAPQGTGAAKRYRVRLGPIADRATAAGVIAKLQAHRHTATLVQPTE
jgi:rare lipoprotein A